MRASKEVTEDGGYGERVARRREPFAQASAHAPCWPSHQVDGLEEVLALFRQGLESAERTEVGVVLDAQINSVEEPVADCRCRVEARDSGEGSAERHVEK